MDSVFRILVLAHVCLVQSLVKFVAIAAARIGNNDHSNIDI